MTVPSATDINIRSRQQRSTSGTTNTATATHSARASAVPIPGLPSTKRVNPKLHHPHRVVKSSSSSSSSSFKAISLLFLGCFVTLAFLVVWLSHYVVTNSSNNNNNNNSIQHTSIRYHPSNHAEPFRKRHNLPLASQKGQSRYTNHGNSSSHIHRDQRMAFGQKQKQQQQRPSQQPPKTNILTAYVESPTTVDTTTKPLPIRNTKASQLLKIEYPHVTSCTTLMEDFPIDDYPTNDPFLPWIHDYFPSLDGTQIQFIAQNKRRCHIHTTTTRRKHDNNKNNNNNNNNNKQSNHRSKRSIHFIQPLQSGATQHKERIVRWFGIHNPSCNPSTVVGILFSF